MSLNLKFILLKTAIIIFNNNIFSLITIKTTIWLIY